MKITSLIRRITVFGKLIRSHGCRAGGYLQWEEYERAASLVSVKPDIRADAIEKVRHIMSSEPAKGSGEVG